MSKKRVYELAKELGIENKDLLTRLEKLGIAVKSHSSTLEDSDVERVKKDFLSAEPREVVEKRIKSTVIRRRAVITPVEEAPAAETQPEEAPVAPPEPQEQVIEPEATAPEAAAPVTPAPVEQPVAKEAPVEPEKVTPPAPPEAVKVEAPVEGVQGKPAVQPPPTTLPQRDIKKFPPRRDKRRDIAPAKPQGTQATIVKAKIVEPAVAQVVEKPAKVEADKYPKKGKKPVEVIMGDQVPARKKAFIKKIVDKKDKREVLEVDERPQRWPGKWKEDKKVVAVKMKKTEITVPKAIKRRIRVVEAISVGDLAKKMGVKASEVINKLMALGLMVTINQSVDIETATLIASEFNYQVEAATEYEDSMLKSDQPSENLKPRAPVVTIMGHVDHGKTSLLDAIRQTNVIDGEAGGITQAIGAYHVHLKDRDIVFLDTPGHEAFTAMRARGAKVTDIVVLVVAADDGVMDQTVEAINHSRSAGVPIMVAINKIDKPGADSGKIKQALTEYGLVSEEWGGDTIFCEVSAKKKIGIEELLELILLQADILELKADPDRSARGVIIEAKLDRGRGPVATVLIQEGTLREGDAFVSKSEFGRVRALVNDQGKRVREAGPSMPVEVIGFSGVPQVSAELVVVEDDKKARNIGEYWLRKERERELSASSKITLEQLYQKIKEGVKELNVIIKGDVQGSIEALSEALNKLSTADIKLKIIHSSTGAITETDVMLASASNAIIIGFNVRPDGRVAEIAETEGVDIKLYDIIYNVIADVKAAMEGLLEPVYKEVIQGRAEVRQLFKVPKVGTIAGSYVQDGKITRQSNLKLVRDGIVIYTGKIASLRRLKDDVREVMSGFECGIGIENFNDIKEGDIIEAYTSEKVDQKL
jgi:translation initiation factor IF-2